MKKQRPNVEFVGDWNMVLLNAMKILEEKKESLFDCGPDEASFHINREFVFQMSEVMCI